MKKNMGIIDRGIRILAAITIFVLYLGDILTGMFGIALLVISGILVITSFMGFCPAYLIFGANTCERKGKRRKK